MEIYHHLIFLLAAVYFQLSETKEDATFWMNYSENKLRSKILSKPNTKKAKNIVLFLGDGMGLSTVTATRIYKGQLKGKSGEETDLVFDEFPDVGLVKTYTTDHQVPDSSATMTAIMYGFKTKSGVIGVDETVTRGNCSTIHYSPNFKSILVKANEQGKSVGIVTTTSVTHGTPAATFARTVERLWHDDSDLPTDAVGKCSDIAAQYVGRYGKHIDVIFGGGRRHFYTDKESDPEYPTETGRRTDGRNLVAEWKAYQNSQGKANLYVYDQAGFDAIDPNNVDRVLGLFETNHLKFESTRLKDTGGEPSLAQMTKTAIKILRKNENGFFLVVEGGRIDHAHHASAAKMALMETLQFESAVGKALELTDVADTLTLVTADHSHVFNVGGYPSRGRDILGLQNDGTDVGGLPYTTLLYANGPGFSININGSRPDLTNVDTSSDTYRQESAVQLMHGTHGGEDVPIYANGPMSWLFTGVMEQSYIAHAIEYAALNNQIVSPNQFSPGSSTSPSITVCLLAAELFSSFVVHFI